jgi:oligopeptide transport system permease protein
MKKPLSTRPAVSGLARESQPLDPQSIDPALFIQAPFDAAAAELTGYSRYSYWRSTVRTFLKSRTSIVLLVLMVSFSAFAFLHPVFSSTDPNQVSLELSDWNQRPGPDSGIFGTDMLGRDMWARTWYGTRTSLTLGFVIALFDVGIGMIAGALWGYVKRLDRIMTEIYNVLTNIPRTVVLVLLSYILQPGFWTIVIAMCATGWIGIARFVRNKVLTIRDSEYNVASRCLGTPLHRIVLMNILPYLVSIVIMQVALTIPYTIVVEVFLGFVGLGLPVKEVSLGNLVNLGKNNFMLYPYQLMWPTLILAAVTISFYIVGNKFADASDPRNHV